jgi:hypothetical protein
MAAFSAHYDSISESASVGMGESQRRVTRKPLSAKDNLADILANITSRRRARRYIQPNFWSRSQVI